MSKSSIPQSGILLYGPGAVRLNDVFATLVPLTPKQHEMVNKAKNYALEQSIKSLFSKQVVTSQQQQQKYLKRHQALLLMCRVYVGSISFELREDSIKAAFAPFGAIKSVNMTWDPATLKHKGYAFVEYELPEAAQLALEHMNGLQLGNRQIRVGRPSNIPQAAPVIQQIQEECKQKNRIYLSNIHTDLSETEISNLFEPFGKVRSCRMALTPNIDKPTHRGYGYIEFESEASAGEALTLNNFELANQRLHVCQATTPAENVSNYGTLDSDAAQAAMLAANPNNSAAAAPTTDTALDHEHDGNEDCDKNHDDTQERQHDQPQEVDSNDKDHAETNVEEDSSVIILKNMVTADESFDDNLQLDVYEECSKHGPVAQVLIYCKRSNQDNNTENNSRSDDQVKIFVKFRDGASARRARSALNGRLFAGRTVSAEHFDRSLFRIRDLSGA